MSSGRLVIQAYPDKQGRYCGHLPGEGKAMTYSPAQVRASRAEGRRLTAALAAGHQLAPVKVPFRLSQGEVCYARGQAQLWQWMEGDGTYIHRSGGGFGLIGLAIVASNAAGNRTRRSRAMREAAPRFRLVDQGVVYLTSERFVFQGAEWSDIWYHSVRVPSCNGTCITFELSGAPPTQLHVWPIDYFFALFHYLAYNEIIQIPPDD